MFKNIGYNSKKNLLSKVNLLNILLVVVEIVVVVVLIL
jgi:hypothetical protein